MIDHFYLDLFQTTNLGRYGMLVSTSYGIRFTQKGNMSNYTIHLNELEEIVYQNGHQSLLSDPNGIQEISMNLNHDVFTGSFTEVVTKRFRIRYGSGVFPMNTCLLFESDEEIVEMHFTLSGSSLTEINGFSHNYGISNNYHNIFYGSELKGKITWETDQMIMFEINFHPSIFKNYLPDNNLFNKFRKNIENKQLSFLSHHNHRITPQMLAIIQQIMHCQLKNQFKELFLESKVLELLLLQLEQINICNDCKHNEPIIQKSHTDKMVHIKDYIDQHLLQHLSLKDLAVEINSNECTLKKGFKETFGTTVFSYIRDQKMQMAKQYLLDHKVNINEVSNIIGYKNPQHFSTAFKKHFGYTPSVLLKH